MSVGTVVKLYCDLCDRSTGPRLCDGLALRRDVSILRGLAAEHEGWQFRRRLNTGPNGDYCPSCVERLFPEKSAKKVRTR